MQRFKKSTPDQDKFLNPPMKLNGFLLPERKPGRWIGNDNALGPGYKGTAVEVGGLEKPHGVVKWFNQEECYHYDMIARVWCEVEDKEKK